MPGIIREIRQALVSGVESCFLSMGFKFKRGDHAFIRRTAEIEQNISISTTYHRGSNWYSYDSHIWISAPALDHIRENILGGEEAPPLEYPVNFGVSGMWFYFMPFEERKTIKWELIDVADVNAKLPELKRRLETYILPFFVRTETIDGLRGWLEEKLHDHYQERYPNQSDALGPLSLIYILRNDRDSLTKIIHLVRNPKVHENHQNSMEQVFSRIERAYPSLAGCFAR